MNINTDIYTDMNINIKRNIDSMTNTNPNKNDRNCHCIIIKILVILFLPYHGNNTKYFHRRIYTLLNHRCKLNCNSTHYIDERMSNECQFVYHLI